VRTASWGFVRLHEGTASPPTAYGRRALERWVERIADHWSGRAHDCFVYFNNDHGGAAAANASQLAALAVEAGVRVVAGPLARGA